MQIESERLLLRSITPADAAAIFAYRSDATTNRYQSWVPKSRAEVGKFIERLPVTFNQPETWYQLAVVKKKSGTIIGDIGIHFVGTENRQCELGCTFDKAEQGHGFATEGMQIVIDHLFDTLNKHRIVASVDPRNRRSILLLERLRFRKEGHFRQSLYFNGEWVDDIIYALLASDRNA